MASISCENINTQIETSILIAYLPGLTPVNCEISTQKCLINVNQIRCTTWSFLSLAKCKVRVKAHTKIKAKVTCRQVGSIIHVRHNDWLLESENWNTQRKTCCSCNLSTTNLSWPSWQVVLGLHGEKVVPNCLINDTALQFTTVHSKYGKIYKLYLLLVNGIRFLLIVECRTEVTHATLCPCYKVETHSHFQRFSTIIANIQC